MCILLSKILLRRGYPGNILVITTYNNVCGIIKRCHFVAKQLIYRKRSPFGGFMWPKARFSLVNFSSHKKDWECNTRVYLKGSWHFVDQTDLCATHQCSFTFVFVLDIVFSGWNKLLGISLITRIIETLIQTTEGEFVWWSCLVIPIFEGNHF